MATLYSSYNPSTGRSRLSVSKPSASSGYVLKRTITKPSVGSSSTLSSGSIISSGSSSTRALEVFSKDTGESKGFLGADGKYYTSEKEAVESKGGTYRGGSRVTGGDNFGMAPRIQKEQVDKLGDTVTRSIVAIKKDGGEELISKVFPKKELELSATQKLGKDVVEQLKSKGFSSQEISLIGEGKGNLSSRLNEDVFDSMERMFFEKKQREKVQEFELIGKALEKKGEGLSSEYKNVTSRIEDFNKKFGGKSLPKNEFDVAQKELAKINETIKDLEAKSKSYEESISKYSTTTKAKVQRELDDAIKKQKKLLEVRGVSKGVLDSTGDIRFDPLIRQKIEAGGFNVPDRVTPKQVVGLAPSIITGVGKSSSKKAFAKPSDLQAFEEQEKFLSLQKDVRTSLSKGEIGSAFARTLEEFNATKEFSKGNVIGGVTSVLVKEGGGLLTLGLLASQGVGQQLAKEYYSPGTTIKGLQAEYDAGLPSINKGVSALFTGISTEASSDPVSFFGGLAIGGFALAKAGGVGSGLTKPRIIKGSQLNLVRDVRIGSGKSFVAKGTGVVLFKETTKLKKFLGKSIPSSIKTKLPVKLQSKLFKPNVRTIKVDYDLLVSSKGLKPKPGIKFSVDKPIGAPFSVQPLVSDRELKSLLAYQKRIGTGLTSTQKGSVKGLVRINDEPFVVKNFFKVKGSGASVRTAPVLDLITDQGKVVAVRPLGKKIATFKSKLSVDDGFSGSVSAFSKENLTLFRQRFSSPGQGQFLTRGAVVKGKAKSFFDVDKFGRFKNIEQVKTAKDAQKIISQLKKKGLAVPKELDDLSKGVLIKYPVKKGGMKLSELNAAMKTEKLLKQKANISPGLLDAFDEKQLRLIYERGLKVKPVKDFTFKSQAQAREFVKSIKEYNARARQLRGGKWKWKPEPEYKPLKFISEDQAREFVKGIKEYNKRSSQLDKFYGIKKPVVKPVVVEKIAGKGVKTLQKTKPLTKTLTKPITIKASTTPIIKSITSSTKQYLKSVYGPTIVLKKQLGGLVLAGKTLSASKTRSQQLQDIFQKTSQSKSLSETKFLEALSKSLTKTLSEVKTKSLTDTMVGQKTKTISLTGTLSDTQTLTDTQTKTKTLTDTLTKTLTDTKTSFSGINFNFNVKPPITPIKPLFPRLKEDSKKGGYREKATGYHAYVRGQKGWKKITKKPLLENKAWNRGFEVADQTVAQSVTLKPTKKVFSGWDEPKRDFKFRKKSKRSKISKKPVLIEKRKHAIDTLGERKGLSVAKYLKSFNSRLRL